MEQTTIKNELLEWLAQINDEEVLEYLKSVKEEVSRSEDWYENLSPVHKEGIDQGLKDIEEGRVVSHSEVAKKYGLES